MSIDSVSTLPQNTYPNVRVSATGLELWRGDRCLFNDLSFTLNLPVLHVCGANGSGKTTLLKVLCGLTITERGNVTWTHDKRILTTGEVRGQLAYTGHQEALNPALTVAENLQWGAGLYRELSNDEIQQATEEHQLDSLTSLLACSLSAGQKRRVALLRSVLSHVPVWVWDEPYANLDAAGVEWVNALIEAHVARGGCLILSAHQKPAINPEQVQTLGLTS